MNLDRITNITSELSSSLVKSIGVPGGILEWLTRPLAELLRERQSAGRGDTRAEEAQAKALVPEAYNGPVVLLGGCPAPDEALVAMVHLAGGRSARVAILPVAAGDQAVAGAEGLKLLTRFGMRKVEVLDGITRELADDPDWAAALSRYDAVFLCGRRALLGLEILQGTRSHATLKEMQAAGKLLAGLDAGASMLGDRLLINRDDQSELLQGLGLLPGLLIEFNFTQETRFGRVARVLNCDEGASLLGVGVDAGAALVVRAGEARVLGDGGVSFLDPRESGSPVDCGGTSGCSVKVHVLTETYGFNFRTRKPFVPVKENLAPPQAAAAR